MVAKGTKRKVNEADVTAQKSRQLAETVAEAGSGANVSQDVLEMMVDLLPHTLVQPKDKRHRFQEQAIQSMNCVMRSIEESLKKSVETAKTEKLEAEQRAAPCEKDVADTEAKLKKDCSRVQAETQALAKAAMEFRNARTAVKEAQTLQETGDEDYKGAAQKKEKLQDIIDNFITPLKMGEVPEADVEKRCRILQSELKVLDGFDEAMLMVLGSSFAKAPAARGGFDIMAIDQLEKQMSTHLQPINETLLAGEDGKKQRADSVKFSQQDLEEALKAQKLQAAAFESAWQAQEDDKKALELARQALKDLASQTKVAGRTLYQVEANEQVFQEFARKPFEELKERVTPEPVEPEQTDALDTGVTLPEAIAA